MREDGKSSNNNESWGWSSIEIVGDPYVGSTNYIVQPNTLNILL